MLSGCRRVEAGDNEVALSNDAQNGGMRILLVENHADTLRWLTLYLEDSKHEVTPARTMSEAVEKLKGQRFDVLLSDIGLPDGLGWALPRKAKAIGRIKAVAISGVSATAELERSRAAGFDHYLLKPFKTAELDRVLEEVAKSLKEPAGASADADALVIEANERAQRQIGHELHETLCQTLAGASIFVSSLARRGRTGEAIDAKALEELDRQLHLGIEQARGLYRKFDPANLDAAGLLDALDSLAKTTATVHACEFVCEKPVIVADPKLALAIYRTAQEGVRNAVEHAHGTKVSICLTETEGAVELCVKDDGRGFDGAGAKERFCGLALLEAYARNAGATLRVDSQVGAGTVVCLERRKQG